ncbi:MAG: hypothetical protein PHP45_02265 [Elusimicrobiales bacterium]|nr:hypothetical protein [Elusimicrobiales bacterium]
MEDNIPPSPPDGQANQPELPLEPAPPKKPARKISVPRTPRAAPPARKPSVRKPAAPRKGVSRRRAAKKSFAWQYLFDVQAGGIRIWEYVLWILLAVVCVLGFRYFHYAWFEKITLSPVKPVYYRDEIIRAGLFTRNTALRARWQSSPPVVRLLDGAGRPLKGIGGQQAFYMERGSSGNYWRGAFACPWNLPPGKYRLSLEGGGYDKKNLHIRPVEIARRVPAVLPPGFVVLTMEYANDYRSLKIKLPDGRFAGGEGVAEWAKYLGADAVWVLVGKTSGFGGRAWNPVDLEAVRKIGENCHKRGLKFGVWAMSYLTQVDKRFIPRYEWALELDKGVPVQVRAISLRDKTRPDDIAELLSKFEAMPEVDYLGLDYIRNALGGYELMNDFYAEMPWAPRPAGWDRLSYDGRLRAFAQMKISRANKAFIDDWQWWRAHRVAQIVRYIKGKLGTSKRLWTFTLGWEKGWQHGQDPVMMNDAGADADAVMLYEANAGQYAEMMKDWHSYAHRADAQLVAGNAVDWPLHQGGGAAEYKRRFAWAERQLYADGPVRGIFIHDLTRLLHGRLGPLGTQQWAAATKEVIADFRALSAKEKK